MRRLAALAVPPLAAMALVAACAPPARAQPYGDPGYGSPGSGASEDRAYRPAERRSDAQAAGDQSPANQGYGDPRYDHDPTFDGGPSARTPSDRTYEDGRAPSDSGGYDRGGDDRGERPRLPPIDDGYGGGPGLGTPNGEYGTPHAGDAPPYGMSAYGSDAYGTDAYRAPPADPTPRYPRRAAPTSGYGRAAAPLASGSTLSELLTCEGGSFGRDLGCRIAAGDVWRAEGATYRALAANASADWSNPRTGAYGRVTLPERAYGGEGYGRGDGCRVVRETLTTVGGRAKSQEYRACPEGRGEGEDGGEDGPSRRWSFSRL